MADSTVNAAMGAWEEMGRSATDDAFFIFVEGFRQGWMGGKERWVTLLTSDWPETAEGARLELLGALKRRGKDATITIEIMDTPRPVKEEVDG